jgi:hypothetical protein
LSVRFGQNTYPRKKPRGAGGGGGADRGEGGKLLAAERAFALQSVQYSGKGLAGKGAFVGTHNDLHDEKVLTSGEKRDIIGG